MESFTTGQLKLEAAPTDIVLVLDMSGSMKWRMGTDNATGVNDNSSDSQYWSRFKTMKQGVLAFIDAIDDNDKYLPDDGDPSTPRVLRAKRLGNKIGIVTFAGSSAKKVQTPILLGNDNLDTGNASGKNTLISAINGLPDPNDGTPADEGIKVAYDWLKVGSTYMSAERKLRTAVLFTDGALGSGNYWSSGGDNETKTEDQSR